MAAEISGKRGKGEYTLIEALSTQRIRRGGGGGRGAAMGEMEMVAVRWSARETTAEVMLCSVARLGSTARGKASTGE